MRKAGLPADVLTSAGIALHESGHWHEAEALLTAALDARPYDPLAMWHRGLVRLALGNFAEGWKDYGYRLLMNAPGGVPLFVNLTVDDLADRAVIVHAEQGIGDEIMFASCIPDLMNVAESVALSCDDRLCDLFKRSFSGIVAVGRAENCAGFGSRWNPVHIASGSLPHAFRQRREDFSGAAYLERQNRPSSERCIVGLCWNGGTVDTRRALRSLDRVKLERAAKVSTEVQLLNLTHDDLLTHSGWTGDDAAASADFLDFSELARHVCRCDLIVTVQCSIAHLAGALGVPCLVLLSAAPEWRYGAQGASMPWYRSVELTRQERLGDWTVPLTRARERVAELVRTKRTA